MPNMSDKPKRRKKPMTSTASKSRHKGWQLPARVGQKMKAALKDFASKERRSVSQAITILLEEALAARGLWPPQNGT